MLLLVQNHLKKKKKRQQPFRDLIPVKWMNSLALQMKLIPPSMQLEKRQKDKIGICSLIFLKIKCCTSRWNLSALRKQSVSRSKLGLTSVKQTGRRENFQRFALVWKMQLQKKPFQMVVLQVTMIHCVYHSCEHSVDNGGKIRLRSEFTHTEHEIIIYVKTIKLTRNRRRI